MAINQFRPAEMHLVSPAFSFCAAFQFVFGVESAYYTFCPLHSRVLCAESLRTLPWTSGRWAIKLYSW